MRAQRACGQCITAQRRTLRRYYIDMRRVWWGIALVAVVVTGFAIALYRPRKDDFAMLRPYVVSETHEFHKPAQVMPGMDHYCEVTYLHAEKLPPHLQDRLTSSMIVGGWKCWQSPA